MTATAFSKRQQRVLRFVARYIERLGIAPTRREIGRGVGISTPSVVNYHLNKLVEKGALRLYPNIARGIVLTDEGRREAGVSDETPEGAGVCSQDS